MKKLLITILIIAYFAPLVFAWGGLGAGGLGMGGGGNEIGFIDTFTGVNGDVMSPSLWDSIVYTNQGYLSSGSYWNIQSNKCQWYIDCSQAASYVAIRRKSLNSLPVASGRYVECEVTGGAITAAQSTNSCSFNIGMYDGSTYATNTVYIINGYGDATHNAVSLYARPSSPTLLGTYNVLNSSSYTVRLTLDDASHASVQVNGSTVISSQALGFTMSYNPYAWLYATKAYGASGFWTYNIDNFKFK